MKCAYGIAYVYGGCGADARGDERFCDTHLAKKCSGCGGQATGECCYTGQFVCGAPICDDCEGTEGDSTKGLGWGFIGHRHVPKSPPPPSPQEMEMEDRHDLGPPAGLEHVEAELRSRMSDGNSYGLIAEIVAWKEKALADARDEALAEAEKEISGFLAAMKQDTLYAYEHHALDCVEDCLKLVVALKKGA